MVEQTLVKNTAHVFARTCKLFRARAHALLGEIGLCRGQPFVLHALWEEEGIPHSVLAGRLNVTPATVTNMLKRMEKAGLVQRRQDEEDHRVSRAYLTDAGREIRAPLEEMWRAIEQQAFAGFSSKERDSLCQLLVRMQDNLLQETADEENQG